MSITADQVAKIAKLARLAPTPEQAERYRTELSAILGYVERLQALDLTAVAPMASPLDMGSPLGEDVACAALPTDALIAMAPAAHGVYLTVPKVLGGDE